MNIFVFGNEDLEADSLPLRILPVLEKKFRVLSFKILDPNEEWELSDELIIIDTVINIKEPVLFTDLDSFSDAPRVTMHDFDAISNLRYLKKLGKFKTIKIIGVPPQMEENEAVLKISAVLKSLV